MTHDVIITLANMMDDQGRLNDESRARVDLACDRLVSGKAQRMMVCGWAYQEHSDLAIADAMAAYASKRISGDKILVDRQSRDTVGDAVFSRLQLDLPAARVAVATSDYHVPRTREIFRFVYGGDVDVFGAPSDTRPGDKEAASLKAFAKTFEGISPGDIDSIYERMRQAHPLYNGTVHPKI